VYQRPTIYHNFITPEEREYIIESAKKELSPSVVSEDRYIDDSVRKSETAWLSREDPIVENIMMRCLKHTDRPFQNCEKLQILRYKSGGYYKPHQDAFENDSNMRLYTFILALNDDYEGGETVFPNLGKEYKLKAGDALFFDTLDNYECMTSKALHGGKPVKSGEKWICNLWVRKYPY
jgi:prolyl 4-hydroxylase|tara:strand:+ start:203 stop:736 length:534 start_codon:yes stop_codon:yes gene_type:complete